MLTKKVHDTIMNIIILNYYKPLEEFKPQNMEELPNQ